MTRRIGNTLVVEAEPPQQCDFCKQIAELRPYGPNGEVRVLMWHNSRQNLAALNSVENFTGGFAMAERGVEELPLWGSKCSVCGLGFLSWSKEHVGDLLALHQAEHVKRFTRLEARADRGLHNET